MIIDLSNRAVHFGIIPTREYDVAAVAGHDDSTRDIAFPLTSGSTLYVEGSWACWGIHDQDTDGDNTLHVVFHPRDNEPLPDQVAYAKSWLLANIDSGRCRLLDYAVVSTRVWSETVDILTLDGEILPWATRLGADDDFEEEE